MGLIERVIESSAAGSWLSVKTRKVLPLKSTEIGLVMMPICASAARPRDVACTIGALPSPFVLKSSLRNSWLVNFSPELALQGVHCAPTVTVGFA